MERQAQGAGRQGEQLAQMRASRVFRTAAQLTVDRNLLRDAEEYYRCEDLK